MGPLFLFLIYGIVLFLVSFIIPTLKDPRNAALFNWRVHPLRGMSLEDALVKAKESSRIVRVIGIILMVVCTIGLILLSKYK